LGGGILVEALVGKRDEIMKALEKQARRLHFLYRKRVPDPPDIPFSKGRPGS
jgi:hypothetical protein